jgi:hypothetical protein
MSELATRIDPIIIVFHLDGLAFFVFLLERVPARSDQQRNDNELEEKCRSLLP